MGILNWFRSELQWFKKHGDGDRLLAEFFVAAAAGNYRVALQDLLLALQDFSAGTKAEDGVNKLVAELETLGIMPTFAPTAPTLQLPPKTGG